MESNPNILKVIELALIHSCVDFVLPNLKEGREKGLYLKLQKTADRILRQGNRLSKKEQRFAAALIDKFIDKIQWHKVPEHIYVYLSFFLIVLENSKINQNEELLFQIINNLFDFYDRAHKGLPKGKKIPKGCYEKAEKAFNVWENMI